ncbi:MAG: YqgE/AlgH family protein [Actinomycetota bacterium]
MDDTRHNARLKGRLLVATPGLVDPNFFRTVVLVVEHNDDGALGVVLNRPSDTPLDPGPLGEWKDLAADPSLVFVGGPVSESAAVCLGRLRPHATMPGWEPVIGGLGVLDLAREIDEARDVVDRVRVFAGYAGWGAGQLEDEIDEGAWYILDADPEDALSSQPGGLWRFVLQRQGGKLALVANFPADPNMN